MTSQKLRGPIIEAEARKLIGTPFKHQGRLAGYGMDCAGVVIYIASKYDWLNGFEDRRDYSKTPTGEMEMIAGQYMDRKTWNEREQGDVIHFSWTNGKHAQHFGILTRNDTLIHSLEPRGVVETMIGGPMQVRGVYRFRE